MAQESVIDDISGLASGDETAITGSRGFGTFGGVFTPTILTVLGAILFLRTGWIVGNAGLLGAVSIIILANIITFTTGLSIASIATNIRVRAGGPFSIISQSLGLEVGGSVSVPFYIAQSISVAFYVFAFSEGWARIFPEHPEILVVFGCFAVAYTLAFVSASLAVRTQFLILVVLAVALFAIFLGSFEIMGVQGFTEDPESWGSFAEGDFWYLFSIYFPAVTGVLAGVNMSGDLENPRKSIPLGTMSAIILATVIYLAVAYWFSRVATPQELITNQLVVVDKAVSGPAVLAGILAATFSSGLTSLVGAPRLLQAIAKHRVVPGSDSLAELTDSGEPRRAMLVTGVIGVASILFGLATGGLDAIAPLMTMFFLVTYSVLNAVVLFESSLGLVSFRPKLRIPRLVPLVGLFGCLFSMFLIAPVFSLVAVMVVVALYIYLLRRDLSAPWSDIRSGLMVRMAEWSAKQASNLPTDQERAWKPDLLFPVKNRLEMLGSYRFLQALAHPRGSVRVIGIYPPGQREQLDGLGEEMQSLTEGGVFARLARVESENYAEGLQIVMDVLQSTVFRPNGLFLPITDDTDEETLQALMNRAQLNRVGAIFFARHEIVGLGREKVVNVWVRDQSPEWKIGLRLSNIDLALLLAYQLTLDWESKIRLITVVDDPDQYENGQHFLEQVVELGRMPSDTEIITEVGNFNEYITKAPHADLNIFGIGNTVNLESMRSLVHKTHSSCLYVQDSGTESALA